MNAIRRGASQSRDPAVAARELAEQLTPATSAALFFCSPDYDLAVLGEQLAARFAGVELIGCTTAGEIAPDGYREQSIVGMGFAGHAYTMVTEHTDELGTSALVRVCGMVQTLLRKLRMRAPAATAKDTFAVLLIDGLSGVEERVLSAISRELGEIPLVGGSAGDSLRFRETFVFHEGAFRGGTVVLALIHTQLPFEVFKTQHFVSSDRKMVVTEADPVRRVVTEINAEPAGAEYARQSGLPGLPIESVALAMHPVLVRIGGDYYARSIKQVNPDGSLTFYCAIDEGIVLSAAAGTDPVSDLKRLFERIEQAVGPPDAILAFECIYRRLQLKESGLEEPVTKLLACNNVIGFSTYGEQFNAMHLNQTFTGVAFGRCEELP